MTKGSMTPKPRFSGHETFPCRYAWLPKAVRAIGNDAARFADDKQAMVDLGLGKNMVRATRFWVQVSGMAAMKNGSYVVSDLGKQVLGDRGHDQYLEDVRTLWLIHWQLSTHVEEPLFAWDFLLNRWSHPEVTKSAALKAFRNEANRLERDRELSDITLDQHFDTFLHTYVPTKSRKGEIQEDNLDCPLVELRLLEPVGERRAHGSMKHEVVYAFRRDSKPEICSDLFLYAIEDYWSKHRKNEQTLSFRDVAVTPGSPGQIFKLPEADIRERLDNLHSDSDSAYSYRESTTVQQLSRKAPLGSRELLKRIYSKEST